LQVRNSCGVFLRSGLQYRERDVWVVRSTHIVNNTDAVTESMRIFRRREVLNGFSLAVSNRRVRMIDEKCLPRGVVRIEAQSLVFDRIDVLRELPVGCAIG